MIRLRSSASTPGAALLHFCRHRNRGGDGEQQEMCKVRRATATDMHVNANSSHAIARVELMEGSAILKKIGQVWAQAGLSNVRKGPA